MFTINFRKLSFLKNKQIVLEPTFYTECFQFHTSASLKQTLDYYGVLLIDKNADRKQIKLAYYKLSKEYHPDLNQSPGAEEKFKALQEAYQVLSDPQRKLEYDRSMKGGYYDSGRRPTPDGNPFSGAGMYNNSRRATKAGSSKFHHGKTSAYDFDEYYRQHYGKAKNTSYANYNTRNAYSEQDLNDYWTQTNRKQNEETNEIYKRRNWGLLKIWLILLSMYIFIVQSHKRERMREQEYHERNKSK